MAYIKPSLLAAALTICLIAAPNASAAVSCTYDDQTLPKRMEVTMTQTGTGAIFSYDPSTHYLLVNHNPCGGGAGFARNDNVDKIVVEAASAGDTAVRIEDPGAFAPGATGEGQWNSPEIEFELSMGGGTDELMLMGSAASEVFTFGADGVNTGAGALDFDLDITGSGIDRVNVHGSDGQDEISGQGGRGTGAPTQLPMHFYGEESDDDLAGGDGTDDLGGGPGADNLEGGLGTDHLNGESGPDNLSYAHAPAGVRVALDPAEPVQQTGAAGTDHLLGLEDLAGSPHDDDLRSAVPKGAVDGGGGNDRITGGAAYLAGGEGDDVIDPGPEDNFSHYVIGGPGLDTITYARATEAVDVNLLVDRGAPLDGIGLADDLLEIEAIAGSPFADLLQGDDDVNAIDGLGGSDQIIARGGSDLVRARDGAADIVDCGDGEDSAVADTRALDSLVGCEAAEFLPDPASGGDPQQPPASQPAADTTLRLSVGARRAQRLLAKRAVLATVSCAGEPCKVRAGGTLGGLRLKRVTRSVSGDTRTRVKVPLSSRAIHRIRAALADGRHPRLTLRVRATDAAGNSVIRKRSITAVKP
jgi:Ca2+-binding RTX toxin-like protein